MKETKDYRGQILHIRSSYLRGDLTIEQAKEMVEPLLIEMNVRGAEIAKEHGKKFKKLTFGYVFR